MITFCTWGLKGGGGHASSQQGGVCGLFSMMASEFGFRTGALHTLDLETPARLEPFLFTLSFSLSRLLFLFLRLSSFSSHPPTLTKFFFFHLSNPPKTKNSQKQKLLLEEIDVNWGVPALQSPPAEKLGPVKATVGDTVVFKWGGGLSYALYQISKRELAFFFCLILFFVSFFSLSER